MSDKIMTERDGVPYVYCETGADMGAFVRLWSTHEGCPEHLLNCVFGDWGTRPAFVNGQTADS